MSHHLVGSRAARCLPAAFCLVLLSAVFVQAESPKNVLLLTSEDTGSPGATMVVEQALSALRSAPGPVNIYVESLDSSRFPENPERMFALYKDRYAQRRLDLLVTICAPALDFVMRHRQELFPGVPTLFSFVDPGMIVGLTPGANVSGVFLNPDWVSNLQRALEFHPRARKLLVVGGSSPFDRGWESSFRQVSPVFGSRVATTFLTDLPLRDLLADVATAPDDAIILFLAVSRDRTGAAYLSRDVLDMVRRVSRVPIYGPSITYLGHGVVGGSVFDLTAHGVDLGRMALRVLAGERPQDIKPVTTANTVAFDWRELQRFGIPDRSLPAAATVLYRQPGSWTLHRGWVAAVALLIFGQTALIGLLVHQRRTRAVLEQTLTARLRFETLLSDLSAALGGVAVSQMGMPVRAAVGMIRQFAGVERVSIFELSPDGRAVRTVDDAAPGSPATPGAYEPGDLPSATVTLTSLRPFVVGNVDDLPPEAARERETLRGAGIKALVLIPLDVGGNTLGVLSCVSHTKEVRWSSDLVQQLSTLAQVLAGLIQRRQTDTAVTESDRLRGAILASLPALIAVLDRQGTIIAVNPAWSALGRQNGVRGAASISPGVSYLDVCRRGAADGSPGADQALAGIEAVCEGRRDVYDGEYRCDGAEERWFAMKVVPLRRPEGGAVVTHWDITAEKRQQMALRESEQRFRVLADALPVGVWMAGLDKGCTYFNRAWLEFAGRPVGEELGKGWLERVHPDDVQQVATEYDRAFEARKSFSLEYRLRRGDGDYRWMLDRGMPRHDEAGVFHGYVGGCVDITERIEAELRHRELSGRLITAQEDERRRIARDLHDDVQQRLALLAIELDRLALGREPLGGGNLATRAQELWRHTIDIASELHRLSHRLHPSKLEALGLLPTVQGYCRELAQHGLQVTFAHEEIPQAIPPDIALCVFRVVQESLQNVLKHSGVQNAQVRMSGLDGVLSVVITDAGRGFDVASAWDRGGLGLVSMRERLHLVGGAIRIDSVPGDGGTVISFQVPLPAEACGADTGDATTMRI